MAGFAPSTRQQVDRVIAEGEARLKALVDRERRRSKNGRDRRAQLRSAADEQRRRIVFVPGENLAGPVDLDELVADLGSDGG